MFKKLICKLVLVGLSVLVPASSYAACEGEFANPITDFCWSCVFPIRVGGSALMTKDQQDNKSSDSLPNVCNCGANFGTPVSFWEMARMVDVTRDAYCMVGLGGIDFGDPGTGMPSDFDGYIKTSQTNSVLRESFYQVHYYVNSVMYWLEVMSENECLERQGFDVAWMSEADPSWADPELATIFNPDVFMFANPVAQLACSADCLATATDITAMDPTIRNSMYWCSGCNGTTFPMTGHVVHHNGSAADAALLTHRIISKLHRQGAMLSSSGNRGLCGYYTKLQMDKTDYKWTFTYPIPGTKKFDGRCCQTIGASTLLSGSRQEYPVKGEHWSVLLYKKRDCCQGAAGFIQDVVN